MGKMKGADLEQYQEQTFADSITLLTSRGPLATKVFTWSQAANSMKVDDYGLAKLFSMRVVGVSNIHQLALVLDSISGETRTFLVRGRPVDGVDRECAIRCHISKTKRNGIEQTATLESIARHWVPLDIDSLECPAHIDPIHDVGLAVDHVVKLLPAEFGGASVYYQLTSSAGIKPCIRMRLFFWSDRPLSDLELKAWLAGYPCDPAIYSPSQPIYTARPIFVGMADPVRRRSGLIVGTRDVVTPPVIRIGPPDLFGAIMNR